jgi:hypothetical protein
MTIPCNRPYDTVPLDRVYLALWFGLSEHLLSVRLHKMKRLAGLRGADIVTICLDDGEVYDSQSCEHIGGLYET